MRSRIEKNRWIVVIGAILIQLALGAIYSWSVFTKMLTDSEGIYRFSAKEAAWVFSAGLMTFAILMVFAGRLQHRLSPRKLTIFGGGLLGLGYILGGIFGDSFLAQLIFIGFIGGAGIGLAYVVPIAVGAKWYPDKKGMITGLAVAGFGFGATIWVKLAGSWWGGLLNTTELFGLPGVQTVFLIYGIAFAVLVVSGSFVMVNPPENYRPAGWNPDLSTLVSNGSVNYDYKEMLKTSQFYILWMTFILSGLAGLMVIYCIRLFGINVLEFKGFANAGLIAGTAMAWYAIFNGLGRIIWGTLSDSLGRKLSIIIMAAFQGVNMLLIYHGFITYGSETGFIIAASIIGFNFGGNFALFPAITADYFGNKNVGSNYGWIFTAYGIAGILGPQIAGYFKDSAEVKGDPSLWMTPFIIAGAACFLGAILMIFLKQPRKG